MLKDSATSCCAATSSIWPSPWSSARRSAPLVTAFVAASHHAADRGDRGQARLLRPRVHDQRLALQLRRVLQRADLVPDHRGGVFFFVVKPLNTLMARREARAGRRPRRAAVPGVPVGHPGGGATLRVLHRGGRGCLTSTACGSRRPTRSRCRGSCGRRPGGAVAAPRDLVVMTAGFEADGVNSGDVIGPEPDIDAARAFFAEHGVPWGLRVPEEMPWEQRDGCCSGGG